MRVVTIEWTAWPDTSCGLDSARTDKLLISVRSW